MGNARAAEWEGEWKVKMTVREVKLGEDEWEGS